MSGNWTSSRQQAYNKDVGGGLPPGSQRFEKMFKVERREAWHHEDEFSVEFFAVDEAGNKLFIPGAEVTVDRRFGQTGRKIRVGWASSGNDRDWSDAVAQGKVLAAALAFAEKVADDIMRDVETVTQ